MIEKKCGQPQSSAILFVFSLLTTVAFSSCQQTGHEKELSTPTRGSVKIAVDASLQPLMEAEIETFETIYTNAHVTVNYVSEPTAMADLLNDSVSLAVVTRTLTPDERKVFENLKITPSEKDIAKEGVALIIHPDNRDSTLTIADLEKLLQGQVTSWKQLDPTSTLNEVQVVFDQPDAGIIRFFKDSVYSFQSLPEYCFALKSDSAVINYVAKNKNALGLIGASWISDRDDSTANKFLETIRVVGIEHEGEYYQPYQAYIAQGSYALVRNIVMISREARSGLASGFMSFVAGDKGQRIVLKSGLVPSTMPLRIVEISREPFKPND